MMMTKDLLLHYMCVMESYKERFKDYGYEKESVDEMLNELDKGLSKVYVLMCDKKWNFEE